MNIKINVNDKVYDILDFFDLVRTECGVKLLSAR
jgi:hypothetical protein